MAEPSNAHEEQLLAVLRLAGEGPSLWRRVTEEGRFYTPAPLADEWLRLEPQRCFDNALEAIGLAAGELSYVEGFASPAGLDGFPVHHAWNATPDGVVVDTTWDVVGTAYLGIEIPVEDAYYARNVVGDLTPLVARWRVKS